MSSALLAVITPQIGFRSETFIRRHVRDLAPGRTAVVSRVWGRPFTPDWLADGPVLDLNAPDSNLPRRAAGALLRRLGRADAREEKLTREFLRRQQPRVVMAEYLNVGAPWISLCAELQIPLFGHAHGADVSILLREETWRSAYRDYVRAAGIITMSEVSRQRLGALGLPLDRIHVIPYGVDVPGRPHRRPKGQEIRCVAVGRMVAKKAPILLLDAFRRAAEQDARLRLDFVGEGPLLPACRQFVSALGLSDRVRLHGGLPNERVHALLDEADLFLQHSMIDPDTGDEEGLPVGILEAMAHALPVVSTRHAGIPEAVLERRTGLLVDEGDSAGMATAVLELAQSPQMRVTLGEAAWERARTCFSWERERTDLLRLFGLDA